MGDDGATRLDPREQSGEIILQVGALVERPDADDDGIEPGEFFRREIGPGQAADEITHLFEALGHVVAGAGQVAHVQSTHGQLEARNPGAGRRLEQLDREMIVANFVALVGELVPFDLGDNSEAA